MESIILIQTEVGRAEGVIRALGAMNEILTAEVVTGPYDVVARARTATEYILMREVETAIWSIPGVTRSIACPLASQEAIVDTRGDAALAGIRS